MTLIYLFTIIYVLQYKKAENGGKKSEILKQITEIMRHRAHLDGSIEMIGSLLFGPGKSSSVLNHVRPPGSALVDDWKCLKSMVSTLLLSFVYSTLYLFFFQKYFPQESSSKFCIICRFECSRKSVDR